MTDEVYAIRTSERSSFRSCRRLWNYTSQNRRNLESTRMNHNLAFGIAIHTGMEHFYEPALWETTTIEQKMIAAVEAFLAENARQRKEEAKTRGDLDDERKEEYAKRAELGEGMLRGYAEWADDSDISPISVEKKFQVPIYNEDGTPLIHPTLNCPVVYQVRIDLLVREKSTNTIWVWDHKTTGSLYEDTPEYLELDTQLSSYGWAIQRILPHYMQVGGFVYNELVKSVPQPPKELKKGGLSKDKRQNTTLDLYTQAIKERGLDIAEYSDMLEYLASNEKSFYRRLPVHRSQSELSYQGELILQEARDMLEVFNTERVYPNPDKIKCRGCDFKHPCTVETERGDVEFVLTDPFLYRQRVGDDEYGDE